MCACQLWKEDMPTTTLPHPFSSFGCQIPGCSKDLPKRGQTSSVPWYHWYCSMQRDWQETILKRLLVVNKAKKNVEVYEDSDRKAPYVVSRAGASVVDPRNCEKVLDRGDSSRYSPEGFLQAVQLLWRGWAGVSQEKWVRKQWAPPGKSDQGLNGSASNGRASTCHLGAHSLYVKYKGTASSVVTGPAVK